ncbi:hypothetical protein GCM10023321_50500 [Pseudonocardia eucalypti]|uniref:Uncharacterized protein n=1 Tax=Pseudonocardia eucalypti TaxID=648755 RepID=A0ABP9QKJ0_9PSEU
MFPEETQHARHGEPGFGQLCLLAGADSHQPVAELGDRSGQSRQRCEPLGQLLEENLANQLDLQLVNHGLGLPEPLPRVQGFCVVTGLQSQIVIRIFGPQEHDRPFQGTLGCAGRLPKVLVDPAGRSALAPATRPVELRLRGLRRGTDPVGPQTHPTAGFLLDTVGHPGLVLRVRGVFQKTQHLEKAPVALVETNFGPVPEPPCPLPEFGTHAYCYFFSIFYRDDLSPEFIARGEVHELMANDLAELFPGQQLQDHRGDNDRIAHDCPPLRRPQIFDLYRDRPVRLQSGQRLPAGNRFAQ